MRCEVKQIIHCCKCRKEWNIWNEEKWNNESFVIKCSNDTHAFSCYHLLCFIFSFFLPPLTPLSFHQLFIHSFSHSSSNLLLSDCLCLHELTVFPVVFKIMTFILSAVNMFCVSFFHFTLLRFTKFSLFIRTPDVFFCIQFFILWFFETAIIST